MSTDTYTPFGSHTVDGVVLPTVRGLRHASLIAHNYDTVLTAGPHHKDVKWGHPRHLVQVFGDVPDMDHEWAPKFSQVKRLLDFAAEDTEGSILIHCHAGISRSTATAIGVTIGRGLDPERAVAALAEIHPSAQAFMPNEVVIAFVEDYYDLRPGSLFEIVVKHDRGRIFNRYEMAEMF